MNPVLLLLNGELDSDAAVRRISKSASMVLAANGGVKHCVRLKIRPRVVIGDMDSLPKPLPRWKDVVYLCGLVAVHTCCRKAIADGRPELVRRLFAGRLTLADLPRLGAAFDAGHVHEGEFVAPWAKAIDRLGAHLVWSAVIHRVDLESFSLDELLA